MGSFNTGFIPFAHNTSPLNSNESVELCPFVHYVLLKKNCLKGLKITFSFEMSL